MEAWGASCVCVSTKNETALLYPATATTHLSSHRSITQYSNTSSTFRFLHRGCESRGDEEKRVERVCGEREWEERKGKEDRIGFCLCANSIKADSAEATAEFKWKEHLQ